MTEESADTGCTIELPVHAGDTLGRLREAHGHLRQKWGRLATLDELAAEVGLPERKVIEALRFAAEPLSLSEPLREGGGGGLGDVPEERVAESPLDKTHPELPPSEIARLLSPLDERQREILKRRYGLDWDPHS